MDFLRSAQKDFISLGLVIKYFSTISEKSHAISCQGKNGKGKAVMMVSFPSSILFQSILLLD